jgi:hypothetical protein
MIVQVIKCQKKTFWYDDFINSYFEVLSVNKNEGVEVHVPNQVGMGSETGFIGWGDFFIVPWNTKVDMVYSPFQNDTDNKVINTETKKSKWHAAQPFYPNYKKPKKGMDYLVLLEDESMKIAIYQDDKTWRISPYIHDSRKVVYYRKLPKTPFS